MAHLPPEEYYESLPKKRMAAGTVWLDDYDNLLIGKLSYSDKWSIPGGAVEEGESPQAGAKRETREEMGLEVDDPRLLCVHYMKAEGVKTETIQFYFFGGRIESGTTYALPDGSEWTAYQFASPLMAQELLTKDLAERVPDWMRAIRQNTTVYIES